MSTNIVRLSCACRKVLRGVHDARLCFFMNRSLSEAVLEYPDYSADFEVLSNEEAKKTFRVLDGDGLVHYVRTFTPFIYSMMR